MRPKFLKTLTFSLIVAHIIGSISMLGVSIALAQTSHGIAMHGEMSLPSNYKKFSFADSRTIIGGKLTRAEIGSFDSLNPFWFAARHLKVYVISYLKALWFAIMMNPSPYMVCSLKALKLPKIEAQ